MARADKITIPSTPTEIANGDYGSPGVPASVLIKNTGGATIYIGGSTVDAVDGFPIAAGESVSLDLVAGEELYAISAGSVDVNFLYLRG